MIKKQKQTFSELCDPKNRMIMRRGSMAQGLETHVRDYAIKHVARAEMLENNPVSFGRLGPLLSFMPFTLL